MKKALVILHGIMVALAAFFTVSLIYTLVISIFVLITGIEQVPTQVDYCLMVLAVMLAIIPIYLWYRRYIVSGEVEQAKASYVFTIRNIGVFLMIGLGCQYFFVGILSVLRPLLETLFSYYDETMDSLFATDPIIVAVYVVVLAPIIEELMLRGIVFSRLRKGLGFPLANVIQATIFAIYHWDVIQGAYAFALGLVLAYVYEKTRTLLAPILLHFIINASGFLLAVYKGPDIPIWLAIIVGGALLVGGVYLFDKSINEKNRK